ncbi:MAG: glycosyltransferase family 39 protein [Alphaproteobacteria bacterium]
MVPNPVAFFPSLSSSSQDGRASAAAPSVGYALPLLLCVTVLTAFRLGALYFSHTELFFDEAQYWFWSQDLAAGYYSKPPLIAWIIRTFTEICGNGEACVRAPSPLLHAATAMVVYGIGSSLSDARVGFWAGLVYATLPGVSFSSGLISTDVPLLLFVALALWAVVSLREGVTLLRVVALGVALGMGLLAKYAMSYFVLSLVVYALVSAKGRTMLKAPLFYLAPAIAVLFLAPNIAWNVGNGFATFSHTADNAGWGGSLFHWKDALEFLIGQLGVAGPVIFVTFVWLCIAWMRQPRGWRTLDDREKLLLAFSIPVLVLMMVQSFISRAHANWAAFAYIAVTVLVTAAMLRANWTRLFRASIGLHIAVMLALGAGGMLAGNFASLGVRDPYSRVLGWRAIADATITKAHDGGFRAIATDRRALAASLLYYLRDADIPVTAFMHNRKRPRDHFELTRPITKDTPRPILLVSFSKSSQSRGKAIGAVEIAAGTKHRKVYFYAIRGSTD